MTFDPQIVKKSQRRLADVGEVVLSLFGMALTTGEISAHFGEIYGASVLVVVTVPLAAYFSPARGDVQ